MRKVDFLKFYNTVIKHYAEEFVEQNSSYLFVDQPERIYEEYLNQKTLMRVLLGKQSGVQLLDRHKVCAAMTVAILKCRPIVKLDVEDENGNFELAEASKINEQIAFLSSWSLQIAFITAEATKKNMVDREFVFPPTYHNSDFTDTFSRALFWANAQNSLSPELIANVYFLLEQYNDLYAKINKQI